MEKFGRKWWSGCWEFRRWKEVWVLVEAAGVWDGLWVNESTEREREVWDVLVR